MAVHPSHEEEQALVREFFGGDTSGYFDPSLIQGAFREKTKRF